MNDWRLQIELWFISLPKWPLALLGAGCTTLLLWAVALPGAQREAALAAHQLRVLPRSSEPHTSTARQPDVLAAFEGRLVPPEVVSDLMAQIWRQALAQGLLLNKVDYRTEPDAAGGFNRLSITLPIGGTYPAIRKFTFSLMADFPALSLDKLDMKRDLAATGAVEATVHLTLLTKP